LLNDNNYHLSKGRNPDQPDDTEAIVVHAPALQRDPAARVPVAQVPSTGGPALTSWVGLVLLGMRILGGHYFGRLASPKSVTLVWVSPHAVHNLVDR
jgi:hypothetical protein